MPVTPIPTLLVKEVLNPFYLFQIFSMILWFSDNYIQYAACILIISVISACTSLYDTVKNLKNIRKMAHYSCKIQILPRENGAHGDKLVEIDSEELVPGDVIEVP